MKKLSRRIGIGLILLPLCLLGRGAGQQTPASSTSARMDELFDFWNRQDQPGFAVVVVGEGRVLYQKVMGLACQEHATPITSRTVFNTASLSQAFVGQAVAMLESQGRLSPDDDVRKFIPELPDLGVPITLRHLLYHTSGLRDWLPVLQLGGRDQAEVTFQTILEILRAQKKPIFRPGERPQVSNTNYDLLAEVIKRLAGKPYSEWAWENIFKPLKMTRTQYRDNFRSILDDQAFSYNFTSQEYLRGIDPLSVTGSHSLFAPIDDLAKWLIELETAPAERQAVFSKMFAAGDLDGGRRSSFGYGLVVGLRAGRRFVSQTGVWAGSGAYLAYFPDQRFGFIILANWDYTSVSGFAGPIIDIYLPAAAPAPAAAKAPAAPAPPAVTAVKVKPEILDQYAGDYRLGLNQILSVAREDERLVVSLSGRKYALMAVSESEFLLESAGVRLGFPKDAQGKVTRMTWRGMSAPRVVLAKPTLAELREYAGVFANEEMPFRLTLGVEGGALVLKVAGSSGVTLTPDEKDRFTSDLAAAPIFVFQRDEQNKVSGLLIRSEPLRDLIFKKD